MDRRTVMRGAGAALGAVVVGGCSSGAAESSPRASATTSPGPSAGVLASLADIEVGSAVALAGTWSLIPSVSSPEPSSRPDEHVMWEINGLPAHVLLVHALVILVPVASLALIAAAWSPRARRRLGTLVPALTLLALALTPLTTNAGEWLRDRLPSAPLIERHADLGKQLLPYVIGLCLAAVTVFALGRQADRRGSSDRRQHTLRLAVAILAALVAVAATLQTVRIGESGSRAVWEGGF